MLLIREPLRKYEWSDASKEKIGAALVSTPIFPMALFTDRGESCLTTPLVCEVIKSIRRPRATLRTKSISPRVSPSVSHGHLAVEFPMLTLRLEHHEVVVAIIATDAIDMMDYGANRERPLKDCFND